MPIRAVVALIVLVGLAAGPQTGVALAQSGEDLAKQHCASCHAYPEPGLLDRTTWMTSVLPQMGARIGFHSFRGQAHPPDPVAPEGVYADMPLIDPADWEAIIGFYEKRAPESLTPAPWRKRAPLDLFDIETPNEPSSFPSATAVLIDADAQRLVVADAFALTLGYYDGQSLDPVGSARMGGAVSRIRTLGENGYLATIIGSNIGQTEQLLGLLIRIDAATGTLPDTVTRLSRHLHRAVDMASGDFNTDGLTDYVTAGFGTHTGELRLSFGQQGGGFDERTLLNEAGPTSLTRDGEDLYVLMAQGDERVLRIRDFASDRPRVDQLLRFPPSYGSSSLTVRDVDGDGIKDLICTAGDNADISPIYKPYHGVYLFLGKAGGSYRRALFFPFDGAYGAVAEDFDDDGDIDIAAIAYFPRLDHGTDAAGFVYLENTGVGFSPHRVDGLGPLGRFVAISSGDLDGDGDADIALSNLAFGPYGPMTVPESLQAQWLAGPRVVVLRNKTQSGQ